MQNRPVDQQTLNLLHRAFEIVLEQNKISYNKIGIAEEGEQLLFLYETHEEKVHVFKWSKASSVGMSIGTLAQTVLTPIIPQLRLLS
jgi:5,10-methylenetetrahydrofolate reductase